MISNMPKYAQGPIKGYLETGNFKDQQKFPMPNDAETKEAKAQMEMQMDTLVKSDNGPEDSNPKPGVIEMEDTFFGQTRSEFQKSEDGTMETFTVIGNENEGATIYSRNDTSGLDIITVSTMGHEDGVQHYSHSGEGSFISFPE